MKKVVARVLIGVAIAGAAAGIGFGCYSYKVHKMAVQEPAAEKQLAQAVPEHEKAKRVRKVACIGDSITYGSGVLSTRAKDSYPSKLGKLLGDDYKVLNYGLSGRTLQNEGSQPYRREKFFEKSQEVNPDIVLIMLGTNDSKPYNWNADAYETELQDFVTVYKELPNQPQVYLMTCCAAFYLKGKDEAAYNVDKTVIENEVIEIIRRVGEACQVPVIDIFEKTKEHPEYFVDGVHPNAQGNQVIAETVYNSLK